MPRLVDYVQCLHAIGQTTFESSSMKTIGKQSQNPYVLGKLEIPARTCPGKGRRMVTLLDNINCKNSHSFTLFRKSTHRWLISGPLCIVNRNKGVYFAHFIFSLMLLQGDFSCRNPAKVDLDEIC